MRRDGERQLGSGQRHRGPRNDARTEQREQVRQMNLGGRGMNNNGYLRDGPRNCGDYNMTPHQ